MFEDSVKIFIEEAELKFCELIFWIDNYINFFLWHIKCMCNNVMCAVREKKLNNLLNAVCIYN